ncbi:MAG: DUF554 domain-containing protein [Candidatus Delongbacteria bacterium]|nr:DUF554 domain-containing protein [Candidatus Delongbacteria bacterium]
MLIQGTIVNVAAVISGSIIGLIIHNKLPERIIKTVFQGIGLFTLFLGFSMALKTNNILLMVFSLVLGAITGELLKLEARIEFLGDKVKSKIRTKNDKFTEGLVTAFMLFCMGSMTILGAIEEGMGGVSDLLLTKSLMDGFASIALASSLGLGVLFSVVPLMIYQGGLTLFAGLLEGMFTELMINEISAVGGIILIGLGINILEIKKLKILNLVPSLLFIAVLVYYIK